MLSTVLNSYVMAPHDLKSLSQLLLAPTQHALWEAEWRKLLEARLLTYTGNANQQLAVLTLDHLMGTGQQSQPEAQARGIPHEALDNIRDDTYHAFMKVPDTSKPQKAFISITQGAKQPFTQFIDRLYEASR